MIFRGLLRLLFLFLLLVQGTFFLTQECGSRARRVLGQKVGVWEKEGDQQGQMGAAVPL